MIEKVNHIGSVTINLGLNNDLIRYILLVISGIFAGYMLQPVPKWLNNLFDNSNIFKFIVLIFIGSTALYPLDKNKFFNIIIGSIFILVLFAILRKFDK
jgi:hypothetical protein